MKKLVLLTYLICSVFVSLFGQEGELFDFPQTRKDWEISRLADPQTGKIPHNIRFKELAFINSQQVQQANPIASEGTPWMHRGPFHVGGRTRAAAVDVTNENRIVAGGVSSGMWLSTDAGKSWQPTQDAWEISSISCLVQDRRKGYEHIWYAGTGEAYGQSAGSPGAYYYGNGLLISKDSGNSWEPINSTLGSSNSAFNTPWQLVWNVLVDTTRYDSSIVYAATYQNIMRSNDGGATWNVVRKTNAYFNEIYLDADGVLYSTSSSDAFASQSGIFYSTNGWDWTSITPNDWQGRTYKRVVLGIRGSETSDAFVRIYAILNTEDWGKSSPDSRGELEWNAMYVMEVSRNNPKSILSQRDLSQNLPVSKYALNSWRTQGSYDMVVGVFPPIEEVRDIVFIGGTNIFRSTSGFEDSLNTDIIAGYKRNTSLPNFEMWPNQHPDQHVWLFYTSDPKKVLNGNDGGLFYTDNCLSDEVDWKPLNNGYLTTQFYTVALAPSRLDVDPNRQLDPLIIVGAQDNNQMMTSDFSPQAEWQIAYPGDGSYCAIEEGGGYAYFSKQLGNTVRAKLSNDRKSILAKRRIDPIGVKRSDYQFINPFVLDPSDKDIMYMAAGRFVYRNQSLSTIELDGSTDSISQGWSRSVDSLRVINQKITALGICPKINPSPGMNIPLYFGTNVKYVYAIDGVKSGDMKFRALKTPPVVGNASVSCIAVHPEDPRELVVVYSNYGVYSIFRSLDGGDNWEKIAGNLEANENGTGDAPSVRWFKYVPVEDGMVYMVGTSVGLFASNRLDGLNTNWVHQAPGEIGNAVVDMIDYRQIDGTLAVATHGRGVFYARIFKEGAILSKESVGINAEVRIYPNPVISELHISSEKNISSVRIYNTDGKLVYVEKGSDYGKNLKIRRESIGLNSGVCFVIVESAGKQTWNKVIVE